MLLELLTLFQTFRLRIATVCFADTQLNISRQMSTTSSCLVSKTFLKVLYITKLKLLNCDLRKGQASKPQYRTGKHLVFISCTMTSFEAIRPTFPKNGVEGPIEGTFSIIQRAFKTRRYHFQKGKRPSRWTRTLSNAEYNIKY